MPQPMGKHPESIDAALAALHARAPELVALTRKWVEVNSYTANVAGVNAVGAMLRDLSADQQSRLIAAMQTVEHLLGGDGCGPSTCFLRAHQPGDIGWLIQRHAALYAQEYGWDETFEGLAAEVAGKFLRDFDPKRER